MSLNPLQLLARLGQIKSDDPLFSLLTFLNNEDGSKGSLEVTIETPKDEPTDPMKIKILAWKYSPTNELEKYVEEQEEEEGGGQ